MRASLAVSGDRPTGRGRRAGRSDCRPGVPARRGLEAAAPRRATLRESSAMTASQSRSSVRRTAAALRSTPYSERRRMRRRAPGVPGPARMSSAPSRKAPDPTAGSRMVMRRRARRAEQVRIVEQPIGLRLTAAGVRRKPGRQRGAQERVHQRRRRIERAASAARGRLHHAFEHAAQHVRRDEVRTAALVDGEMEPFEQRCRMRRARARWAGCAAGPARADAARTTRR